MAGNALPWYTIAKVYALFGGCHSRTLLSGIIEREHCNAVHRVHRIENPCFVVESASETELGTSSE